MKWITDLLNTPIIQKFLSRRIGAVIAYGAAVKYLGLTDLQVIVLAVVVVVYVGAVTVRPDVDVTPAAE